MPVLRQRRTRTRSTATKPTADGRTTASGDRRTSISGTSARKDRPCDAHSTPTCPPPTCWMGSWSGRASGGTQSERRGALIAQAHLGCRCSTAPVVTGGPLAGGSGTFGPVPRPGRRRPWRHGDRHHIGHRLPHAFTGDPLRTGWRGARHPVRSRALRLEGLSAVCEYCGCQDIPAGPRGCHHIRRLWPPRLCVNSARSAPDPSPGRATIPLPAPDHGRLVETPHRVHDP